jgi:hypothetical protein
MVFGALELATALQQFWTLPREEQRQSNERHWERQF